MLPPTLEPSYGLALAFRRGSTCGLDRLTRSWVLWLSRLEKVENVLCARSRPQSEEMVIRVGEAATATDCHEARVSDLREDHVGNLISCIRLLGRSARDHARLVNRNL
jgi:hypothetical protein